MEIPATLAFGTAGEAVVAVVPRGQFAGPEAASGTFTRSGFMNHATLAAFHESADASIPGTTTGRCDRPLTADAPASS